MWNTLSGLPTRLSTVVRRRFLNYSLKSQKGVVLIVRRLAFLTCLSCCFLLSFTTLPVSAKDNWISVKSRNFFLIGNASEKEVRQVGLKLEQFREVFTLLFKNINFSGTVPTTVVVFKSDSSSPTIQAKSKPGWNNFNRVRM